MRSLLGPIVTLLILSPVFGGMVAATANEPPILIGKRVRLYAEPSAGRPIVGRVTAADEQALTLIPEKKSVAERVDRSSIHRVELSVPPNSRRRTLVGAVVGGLAVTTVGIATNHTDIPNWFAIVPGVVIGAPLGAIVASITAPQKETWVPVVLTASPERSGDGED